MKQNNLNVHKNEIVSLNENLYDDFFVQELEARLETDPLIVGGLVDMFSGADTPQPACFIFTGGCTEYSESSDDDCTVDISICDCILDLF